MNNRIILWYKDTTYNALNISRSSWHLPPDINISDLKVAFDSYDKNEDGRISTDELAIVLRAAGQNPTEADLREMIKQVDINSKLCNVKSGLFVCKIKKKEMVSVGLKFTNPDDASA